MYVGNTDIYHTITDQPGQGRPGSGGVRYHLRLQTISMSTAIVERLFSHMNNIKDSTRTLLGNKNLNNLLEVKVNGPSLEAFKAEESILHWLEICTGTRHVNGHKHWIQILEYSLCIYVNMNMIIFYLYYHIIFLLNKVYNILFLISDSLLIYKSMKAYMSYKLDIYPTRFLSLKYSLHYFMGLI